MTALSPCGGGPTCALVTKERERERECVRQDRPNDPCGAGAIKKLEDRIQSAEQEIEVLGPEIAVSSTSVAPLN